MDELISSGNLRRVRASKMEDIRLDDVGLAQAKRGEKYMAISADTEFQDDFRKVGKDVTAGFEPAGSPSNPTENASSKNLNVAPKDDDLEDDEDEKDDEDDEDKEDKDDDLEDDDEDEEEEEDDEEDLEDDDEEEEDDEDEEPLEDDDDEDSDPDEDEDDAVVAQNEVGAARARRR